MGRIETMKRFVRDFIHLDEELILREETEKANKHLVERSHRLTTVFTQPNEASQSEYWDVSDPASPANPLNPANPLYPFMTGQNDSGKTD